MGLFKRIFKIGEAEAHSLIDKLEDPIKLTDQAIRDLKEDLGESIKALAEVKAMAIRAKNEAEMHKNKAIDFENKAIALLKRAQQGNMEGAEADRLATASLAKKNEHLRSLSLAVENQKKFDVNVAKLEGSIKKLKMNISKWENEARTLKARATVAAATKNVNKQLAGIDSSSTIAILERMKEKVDKEESIAESYAEIAASNVSVEEEINSALEESTNTSDALEALKNKLALGSGDVEDV